MLGTSGSQTAGSDRMMTSAEALLRVEGLMQGGRAGETEGGSRRCPEGRRNKQDIKKGKRTVREREKQGS